MGHPADTFLSTRGSWSKARVRVPNPCSQSGKCASKQSGGAQHAACMYGAHSVRGTIPFLLASQGVAWVNGFNLGWYWPDKGPQMTLFIPGPLLRPGDNELILLEMHRIPDVPTGAGFTCQYTRIRHVSPA